MNNILVADDDKDILNLISLYIEGDDVRLFKAMDGNEVIKIINNEKIDLALLDLMMPGIDGFNLIKIIRKKYYFPIIIVSAKYSNEDKVLCLNLGADDYICKPFNPLELEARVKAHLRRKRFSVEDNKQEFEGKELSLNEKDVKGEEFLKTDNIKLNLLECTLEVNGTRFELTAMEFKLLKKFMENPSVVLTKEMLFSSIWNQDIVDDNTLMVNISKLRNKIGTDRIKTIRGLGYKFLKEIK